MVITKRTFFASVLCAMSVMDMSVSAMKNGGKKWIEPNTFGDQLPRPVMHQAGQGKQPMLPPAPAPAPRKSVMNPTVASWAPASAGLAPAPSAMNSNVAPWVSASAGRTQQPQPERSGDELSQMLAQLGMVSGKVNQDFASWESPTAPGLPAPVGTEMNTTGSQQPRISCLHTHDFATFRRMLEVNPWFINVVDRIGRTPFDSFIMDNNIEACKYLIHYDLFNGGTSGLVKITDWGIKFLVEDIVKRSIIYCVYDSSGTYSAKHDWTRSFELQFSVIHHFLKRMNETVIRKILQIKPELITNSIYNEANHLDLLTIENNAQAMRFMGDLCPGAVITQRGQDHLRSTNVTKEVRDLFFRI